MIDFLNPYKWLLYGALVLALITGATVWHTGKVNKAVHHAQLVMHAQHMAQAEQERKTRDAKERKLQETAVSLDRKYQLEKTRRAAADVAVDTALGSLRYAINRTYPNGGGASTASGPARGADDPRDRIIGECAVAIATLDKDARRLASKVAGLQRYIAEVYLKASE